MTQIETHNHAAHIVVIQDMKLDGICAMAMVLPWGTELINGNEMFIAKPHMPGRICVYFEADKWIVENNTGVERTFNCVGVGLGNGSHSDSKDYGIRWIV